jgi:hypothetical protein
MRIACVMMQKNEKDLLGPWVAYHGHLFGIENLYVYDNGSTEPDVVSLERRFENLGLNIDYSKSSAADFVNKGVILGEKIAALDASGLYDLFIPLDCDEFVVVSEDQKSHSCERADILKELERHINQSQVLAVGANLINVPGAPGYFCRWRYKKVFFAKGCFERMDRGFHGGVSRKADGEYQTKIEYVHMHHKEFRTLLAHSKEKLSKYVDSADPAKLQNYNGNGWHLVKYLQMNESEYLLRLNHEPRTEFHQFIAKVNSLGFDLSNFA